MKFSEFYLCFDFFVKFDIHFLGLPQEIVFGVLQKNVQKNAIFFKLFWYKVSVHWKLKLLSFVVDSVLNTTNLYNCLFTHNRLFPSSNY